MASSSTLETRSQQEPLKIAWQAHAGPQAEALVRGEFEILYGGARAGGKTEAQQVWFVEPSYIAHPKYRFLVVRQNAKDLADWIDRARRMYAPLGGVIVGNPAEIRFPSGAIGRTGHLKDKNAFEHYLGHEYQKIGTEELTLIPSEEFYLKLISSCRSTTPELPPQIFNTTNPGNAGHIWVKNRFVKHGHMAPYLDPTTGKWRIFIKAKVTDNPTIMENDPSYINWLRGLPEKLRRAWLDGDWDVFEGQFFDTWNEAIHVYRPFHIPKEWPRFRAIDWGYSDHLCCLWFAVGPHNHVYVYREYYRNRLTDREYASQIKALSKHADGTPENIAYTVGDPNSFSVEIQDLGVTRFEVFAQHGVVVLPAENSRVEGWARVREYLEPRQTTQGLSAWVHVSSECTNLIRTLPALVHDERKVEDIADGMEDHPADTLRYGLQSRPPIFITKERKYRTNLEAAEAQMEREMRRAKQRD